MASPIGLGAAAAAFALLAGPALACPDVAACGGMSRSYGYYTEQASFGPMVDDYYAPAPYGDSGYGPPPPYAGGPGYDEAPPPYADEPAYGDEAPPPPPPPGYEADGYGYQGSAYEGSSYASRSSSSSSRSSSASVSEYGYDSGWRRVPGPPPPAGYGAHHYEAMSVQEGEYDSGWRVRQGATEVWCPPGSPYARPHPRYGCGVAQVGVTPSFFYDTGGVGPTFIGGGGGGGGGVVVVGGGGRAGAFASAHASASVRVHGGFRGRGCGCGHGGKH